MPASACAGQTRLGAAAPFLGLEVSHVDRHGGREEQELVVPAAGIKLALRNLAQNRVE